MGRDEPLQDGVRLAGHIVTTGGYYRVREARIVTRSSQSGRSGGTRSERTSARSSYTVRDFSITQSMNANTSDHNLAPLRWRSESYRS